MFIVLIPASDRGLVPLEVRPAVRKVGISGGRPEAANRLSGGTVGKKAELTVKSGEEDEEEGGMERCEGRACGEENRNPVTESQLPVNLVPAPRQRLQSTSNATQQVGWNDISSLCKCCLVCFLVPGEEWRAAWEVG